MEQVEVSNGLIKKIHQMVYDELKTKYKINKFVKECKSIKDVNSATSLGDLNRQINELIENYYMCKDIKFNRDINDFFLSEIEYIIFYYL